jgi:hypothetical protein
MTPMVAKTQPNKANCQKLFARTTSIVSTSKTGRFGSDARMTSRTAGMIAPGFPAPVRITRPVLIVC